ncbi:MAG: hypothetical protein A2744_03170 [Candidatus Buchananbacteria bacterium RIFCSPHIGHO2_01_FULL_44_11]|uniref:Glycosyl transferase family 1 domain-containing protein n=1 Tax=Candidatus Buchananbacteria bacterium RIFCSPHIGHO2_01_FULL_44_11 TaxID=1797535 RepID=A0A1G1Y292_9BACT|nr:MAG: hypothetical protein A2744_03170 [Candidatus Buchananbacteria bacterium RIFCSPHIGHO2_01_FULL_44_11]
MRIAIDARMYGAESTTGIGVYVKNLTEALFKINQGNQYYLLLSEPVFSQFTPPNGRVTKIKADCHWYSWSEQIQLPKILNKLKPDLVHFPHFNVPILYSGDYITTIHDITPKFFPGPRVKKSAWRRLAYQLVFSRGLKKAKKIITVSAHTKSNLIKYFAVNQAKIKVIYPGFISSQFKKINEEKLLQAVKNKHGITKPFIFYVGVWRDHKNLPGLIAAFTTLKSKYHLDYQLVLGGKPDARYPEIQKSIDDCPYKKDIILPGFIAENDLPLFYNAADLFVLPSFCEGFGLVAIESLACGTPVVGSDSTSLPEVLGEAALYFDPAQPDLIAATINQALTDQKLRQRLIANAQDLTKKYNWDKCAQATLEIYQLK